MHTLCAFKVAVSAGPTSQAACFETLSSAGPSQVQVQVGQLQSCGPAAEHRASCRAQGQLQSLQPLLRTRSGSMGLLAVGPRRCTGRPCRRTVTPSHQPRRLLPAGRSCISVRRPGPRGGLHSLLQHRNLNSKPSVARQWPGWQRGCRTRPARPCGSAQRPHLVQPRPWIGRGAEAEGHRR